MKPLLRWTLLLLFGWACGPGLDEGALPVADHVMDPDTVSRTDDVDTDPPDTVLRPPSLCPNQILNPCPEGSASTTAHPIVSADWFSPPVVFLDMATNVLLATRPGDDSPEYMVIALDFTHSDMSPAYLQYAVIATLPETMSDNMEPVSLLSAVRPFPFAPFRKIAVFRNPDGYHLFGVPDIVPGPTELVFIDNSFHPGETDYHSAVYLPNRTLRESTALPGICLLGDGVLCFDGATWSPLYEEPQGFVRDIGILSAGDSPEYVLVGDDGLIAYGPADQFDRSLSGLTDHILTSVTVHPYRDQFIVAGENGLLFSVDYRQNTHFTCDIGEWAILRVNYVADFDHFNLLWENGTVLAGTLAANTDGYSCVITTLNTSVITALPLGTHYYVLSPQYLFGDTIRYISIE